MSQLLHRVGKARKLRALLEQVSRSQMTDLRECSIAAFSSYYSEGSIGATEVIGITTTRPLVQLLTMRNSLYVAAAIAFWDPATTARAATQPWRYHARLAVRARGGDRRARSLCRKRTCLEQSADLADIRRERITAHA